MGWLLLLLLINALMWAVWLVSKAERTRKMQADPERKNDYWQKLGYSAHVINHLDRMLVGLDVDCKIVWANRDAVLALKGDTYWDEEGECWKDGGDFIVGRSFFDWVETAHQVCTRGRKSLVTEVRAVVDLPACELVLNTASKEQQRWVGRVGRIAPAGKIEYVVDLKKAGGLAAVDASMTDDLTGLYNRRFCTAKTQMLMDNKVPFVLYFIDLDRFKAVNDTHGHEMGDLVLVEAANRIKGVVRECDFAIRIGGDEFNVLISQELPVRRIEMIGRLLVEALNRPMVCNNVEINISASIGVARFPIDGRTTEELMSKADFAMYSAKLSGKNTFLFFDEMHDRELSRKKTLQLDLRRALTEKTLAIELQPVLDRDNGRCVMAEVLCRWTHPEYGVIPAREIVQLANEFSMASELGLFVMEEAVNALCRYQQRVVDSVGRKMKFCLNLSLVQLQSSLFRQSLLSMVGRAGLKPASIVLEIPEKLLLSTDALVKEQMKLLDLDGFELALDDFGLGHSPLACFYDFKFKYLKLHPSIANSLGDSKYRKVVQAMRSVSDTMEMTLIAKGVETSEQEDEFKRLRINFFQGYRYSGPVPESLFETNVCLYSTDLLKKPGDVLGVEEDFFG